MDDRQEPAAGPIDAWDHRDCAGTPHCPPRCPRFVDAHGEAMVVRPYDPTVDRDSLVSMYHGMGPQSRTLGVPPTAREDVEAWLDHLLDNGRNLVASHDGRVLGHLAAIAEPGDLREFTIFVHEDYRGRGIGTELLKHEIAHAAADGEDGLRLLVAADNRAAMETFRGLDFEVTESWGFDREMRLSFEADVAAAVRRPPARRDA